MMSQKNQIATNALLVFVKNPIEGKVKTRLAQSVGAQRALEIYIKLLHHTATVCAEVDATRIIYYSHFIDYNDLWNVEHFKKRLQHQSADLGKRLEYALLEAMKHHEKVIVIGSDCPGIDTHMIQNAFNQLDHYDMVIGPATDGGFYLLGLNRWEKDLFTQIEWSTNKVFKQLIQNSGSWRIQRLSPLSDIDTLSDWKKHQHLLS
jgi:rSAM/selenodomain-associated transferase 1